MNGKELTVTILGLAGTFLMPWPGQADRHGDPSQRHGVLQAFACTRLRRGRGDGQQRSEQPGACAGSEAHLVLAREPLARLAPDIRSM